MTDNNAQRRSKSYRLPVEDTELLLRDEMRAVRFALEYAKAELSLRDWGVRSTIIVFGSAQIPSPEQAQSLLTAAEGTPALERVRRRARQTPWYELAREFARLVSERGGALSPAGRLRDNVIATGGGPASWKRPIAALATPVHPASASISACRPSRSLTLIRRRN